MHTTKGDAPVSLNNQHNTDGRGLGFQAELQTPSGLGKPEGECTNQLTALSSSSQRGEASKSWLAAALEVWGPPIKKAMGGAVLLVCVAYLGHVSDRLENYGPVRALDQHVIALLDGSAQAASDVVGKTPLTEVQPGQASPSAAALANQPPVLAQTGAVTTPPGCPPAREQRASARLSDGRIVLNEASVAELDSLPGIGAARAQAIVELRDKLKGFKKLSDLLRIRGIGHKSFLKLKEQLVLDRPAPEPPAVPETKPEPAPDTTSVEQPAPGVPASKGDAPAQVAAARTFERPLVAGMIALGKSVEPLP